MVFLASPAASYITGVCLPVDGGHVLQGPSVHCPPDGYPERATAADRPGLIRLDAAAGMMCVGPDAHRSISYHLRMATLLAHITVRPGAEVEFETLARTLYEQTHAIETGVLRYEYWRGSDERTYYTLLSFVDHRGVHRPSDERTPRVCLAESRPD